MSVSSAFLWRFLEDVWDLLPYEDRELFHSYWSGQIQVAADLEQKTVEAAVSTQVTDVPVYLSERWNRFVMNEETCDLFSQTDSIALSGTSEFPLSKKTAFYSTLKVSNSSGQIPHEETIRFFDTAAHNLRYGKIVAGTVSVTLGSLEFVPNRDYSINLETGAIQALDDGIIPPTELVTVRYQHQEYTRGLDYEVDELRSTLRRISGGTIGDPETVSVTYTYNGTPTVSMVGTHASVKDATLTDASQNFSSLLPGRTLTITSGPNAGTYSINSVLDTTSILIDGLFPTAQETDVVYSIDAFPHGIKVSKTIASIPVLQDLVDSPSVVMTEGVDYRVSGGILAVRTAFPLSAIGPEDIRERQMWAEVTNIDKETPYRNFGVLIDFYRSNSEAYKLALQGLWYTFWTGSTPGNLQRGLHILLGLPFAKFAGTVTRVDTTAAQIDVTEASGRTITYTIPTSLSPTVSVGDSVARFASLTTGVTIIDKNSKADFVTTLLGRTGISRRLTSKASKGGGATDETRALSLLAEHLFIPQVLVEAIEQSVNVDELITFLDNMKPAWTDYLFSFLSDETEALTFTESFPNTPDLIIDLTSTVSNNTQNQSFAFNLHRIQKASSLPATDLEVVRRFTGIIISGGTQATGNFRDTALDFADLGVDYGDMIFIPGGPLPGYHKVLSRISTHVLSLDIPDASIVGASGLEYVVMPFERRMGNDAISLGQENIIFEGDTLSSPTTLNTRTNADLAGAAIRNDDIKALLLVDPGNTSFEVQSITAAMKQINEIDVANPPSVPAPRVHWIASAALKRTNNTTSTVTDVFAI